MPRGSCDNDVAYFCLKWFIVAYRFKYYYFQQVIQHYKRYTSILLRLLSKPMNLYKEFWFPCSVVGL